MPQADQELCNKITSYFPLTGIEPSGPEDFLRNSGWKLHNDWSWSKRGVDHHNMPRTVSVKEWDCLLFLVREWDYGGVRNGTKAPHK